MGGFFSSAPKAPEPAPLPTPVDPESEARTQRLETINRNRRGRAGMVTTGERGILTPVSGDTKRLLGE